MTIYGAVPTQLFDLGNKLVDQTESIAAIKSVVTGALTSTTWTGPAREQFESQWTESFGPSLEQLTLAFMVAGDECRKRSAALEQVMGVTAAG